MALALSCLGQIIAVSCWAEGEGRKRQAWTPQVESRIWYANPLPDPVTHQTSLILLMFLAQQFGFLMGEEAAVVRFSKDILG